MLLYIGGGTGVPRYQMGNQKPYIEEQTTQWPKEKIQKVKIRGVPGENLLSTAGHKHYIKVILYRWGPEYK